MTQRPRAQLAIRPRSSSVGDWRRERLLAAGFDHELTATVAADAEFDLHAVLELVDRGCPPELAVRIVAPLEAERRLS